MEVNAFHLVVFDEERATAVVPNIWLKGSTECFWPPYKTSLRINNAALKEEMPGEAWTVHSVRVLFTGKHNIVVIMLFLKMVRFLCVAWNSRLYRHQASFILISSRAMHTFKLILIISCCV